MPKSPLHDVQKRKNIVLLFVLLGLMVLVYMITLMRLTPPA
jgi:predicted membrane channel-forming protein YqfA (hemolysin III family)